MLSIGACVVEQGFKRIFYVELNPVIDEYEEGALKHCSFSERISERAKELGGRPADLLAALSEFGDDPQIAMQNFSSWIGFVAGDCRPVFVGFNTPFDWSFVNLYFHRFLGKNPLGISGLDIKAYYMGMTGCSWAETTKAKIRPEFRSARRHIHHALDDAIEQAEMFQKMLNAKSS